MSDFHQIVARAVKDADFCEKLIANPEETLRAFDKQQAAL